MSSEAPVPAVERPCQNCGAPLLGEHCYACGQPTKGLVRHFGSILGDFFDSVFELDSRILRTLGPLLFRPGFLSTEYFAGRRVRYVSPVRLFVFLSLFAFFAAQLSFSITPDRPGAEGEAGADGGPAVMFGGDRGIGDRMERAATVAEVEALREEAVAALQQARREAGGVPGVGTGLEIAEREVVADAARRIAALEAAGKAAGAATPAVAAPDAEAAAPEAPRAPAPPPAATRDDDDEPTISFNGKRWHRETNPLVFEWLPDAFNDRLNDSIGRAEGNLKEIRDDPNRLKDAFLSTVPTTLFVLLPLFAVLLKIAYAFRRRLYMEHLIVALHSHGFLCAALLLVIGFDALKSWTGGVVSGAFQLLEIAVLAWMPLYLLLTQKRVYGQGWIMTLLKFAVLGTCYFFLVLFGAMASLMISLVSM